jgi:hypothetical protein
MRRFIGKNRIFKSEKHLFIFQTLLIQKVGEWYSRNSTSDYIRNQNIFVDKFVNQLKTKDVLKKYKISSSTLNVMSQSIERKLKFFCKDLIEFCSKEVI